MFLRYSVAALMALGLASISFGQATAPDHTGHTPPRTWHRTGETPQPNVKVDPAISPASASLPSLASSAGKPTRATGAKVSKGTGTLPNGHGQVWREYDISPYTVRVTSTNRPEQAIVDWILRETGYEAWHGEPLGILSATERTLRVYHTPEMQKVVANVVDRFVSSEAETQTYSVRVVTVDNPNWRAGCQQLLRPVPVQTPGVSAWIVEKEGVAVLLAELQRRNDYREHSSPHMLVNNGQSTLVSAMRGRPYVRDVVLRPAVWPGYEAQMGQVDEGFSLEFNPLLSADRQMIDATIRCNIDQVEKMIPVSVDVPHPAAPRQRTQIEVTQMSHFRFHERFRWPTGQVLLVGMGMVAVPVPIDSKAKTLIGGIPLPLSKTAPRADLMVFIEAKDRAGDAPRVTRTPQREATSYRGRY